MNDHQLQDVLLINHKKEIVQTSNGYLFIRFGDVVKTPSESTGVTRLTLRNQFIKQLKEIGSVQSLKEASKPHQANHIHFYFEEDWYALSINPELINDKDPVKKLDSSILTDFILNPILGIKDLKTSDQVDFLPGIFSVNEFQHYGIKNKCPLGFVLYPASIDQIKLVADCGLNMPPKSTWVEPKLRSGLTIYNIKE